MKLPPGAFTALSAYGPDLLAFGSLDVFASGFQCVRISASDGQLRKDLGQDGVVAIRFPKIAGFGAFVFDDFGRVTMVGGREGVDMDTVLIRVWL